MKAFKFANDVNIVVSRAAGNNVEGVGSIQAALQNVEVKAYSKGRFGHKLVADVTGLGIDEQAGHIVVVTENPHSPEARVAFTIALSTAAAAFTAAGVIIGSLI